MNSVGIQSEIVFIIHTNLPNSQIARRVHFYSPLLEKEEYFAHVSNKGKQIFLQVFTCLLINRCLRLACLIIINYIFKENETGKIKIWLNQLFLFSCEDYNFELTFLILCIILSAP